VLRREGATFQIDVFDDSRTGMAQTPALTKRQGETLRLLVSSPMSHKEIAAALKIKVGTVRKHIERLYRTYGVRSRLELLEVAAISGKPAKAAKRTRKARSPSPKR
jgi:DNA-binding CsgD family transcriptional regulator